MPPDTYPAPDPNATADKDWLANYQPAKPKAPKQRLVIMAVAVGVVLSIIILIISSLGKGPNIEQQLHAATASQQEIVRVAGLGLSTDNARSSTKELAATVSAVSTSNLQQLLKLTGELSKEETAAATDATTDTELATAAQTNSFDTTWPEVMTEKITALNATLTQLYDDASQTEIKDTLSLAYENNKQLLDALAKK